MKCVYRSAPKLREHPSFFKIAILLLVCFSFQAKGQNSPFPNDGKPKFVQSNPDLYLADSLVNHAQYTNGLKILRPWTNRPWKNAQDSLDYLFSKQITAAMYAKKYEYDSARMYLDEARQIHQAWGNTNELIKAHLNTVFAELYLNTNQFKEAIEYVEKGISLYKNSSYQDIDVFLEQVRIRHFSYLGLTVNTDSISSSLSLLSKVFDQNKNRLPTYITKSYIHNVNFGRATAYSSLGDYDKSISYFLLNLKSMREMKESDSFHYLNTLYGLCRTFSVAGQYANGIEPTLQLIEKATETLGPKNPVFIIIYLLMGEFYRETSEMDSAMYYYDMGSDLAEELQISSPSYPHLQMAKGQAFQEMGNLEESNRMIKIGLKYNKDLYGARNPFNSNYYNRLAYNAHQSGDYELSLTYNDSALYNIENRYETGLLNDPIFNAEDISHSTLIVLLIRAQEQLKIYEETNKLEFLKAAVRVIDMVHKAYLDKVNTLERPESILAVVEWYNQGFETFVPAFYHLYKETKDEKHLQAAWAFMIASKSSYLLLEKGEFNLLNQSNVPAELRDAFVEAKKKTEELNEELFELLRSDALSDSVMELNTEYVQWADQLSEAKKSLETFDTTHSKLYNPFNSDENETPYLIADKGSAIIEYLLGSDKIIVMAKTSTKESFVQIERDTIFNQRLEQFLRELSANTGRGRLSPQDFDELSHELYKSLLSQTLEELGEVKNITIIPDETLSLLPFEVLVTEPTEDPTAFEDLNYLLKKMSVSYRLTVANTVKTERKKPRSQLLAFSYEGEGISDTRAELGDLPGAKEELNFLESQYSGTFYYGDNGSKDDFLKKAEDYDVLHLALHGQANFENRFKSSLIFNGSDDYRLNVYDLYGVRLNSSMVVLSACESGVGQTSSSEGAYSMARGFITMGVPSVVTSLWKVNDLASAEIVKSFYTNLEQGMTKDEALRQAKLSYLKGADNITSHPYYWGSFVAMGDTSPLDIKKASSFRWYWLLALVLVLVIVSRLGKQPSRKARS